MKQMNWVFDSVKKPNEEQRHIAEQRQGSLTKPPGSLGRLEELAIKMAALQNQARPALNRPGISLFAADHGVADEGVSAFPQIVTGEMIKNFVSGGAAISVLARQIGARLEVVNAGTINPLKPMSGVIDARIAAGTKNLFLQSAMDEDQLMQSLQLGRDAVKRHIEEDVDMFIAGDMGIANTTSATAIICALLGEAPAMIAGPGTGLDSAGVAHKAIVVKKALQLHRLENSQVLDIIRCVGGFEINAMVGAYVYCAQAGLPILVDGFISSAAALAAVRINPQVKEWMFVAHRSAEPGHSAIVESLGLTPILDLGMRLGEASGAATALPLLRLACALHNEMATFDEASVSEQLND